MSQNISVRDDIYKTINDSKQGNQSCSDVIDMMITFCKKQGLKGIK